MLRIDKIMKERNISNQELAKILNVSPQYISEVINERKNITLQALEKIANALDVPVAALIDGYHEKEQLGYSSFNCPYCGKVILVEKDIWKNRI